MTPSQIEELMERLAKCIYAGEIEMGIIITEEEMDAIKTGLSLI